MSGKEVVGSVEMFGREAGNTGEGLSLKDCRDETN